ncbi:holin [Numidum massiliense]|uniref:holin n=1 Tax=Numidum massiliense TaxID=1522315 RepID=UPI0006D53148|nr:holin [Numidum massiliense]
MEAMLVLVTVISPITVAFVEVLKRSFGVPTRLLPLISLAAGVVLGLAFYPFTSASADLRAWAGALAGLAATGLFEVAFQKREG